VRVDAGTLEIGGGLDVLVSAKLDTMPAGAEADVVCASRAATLELPGWARVRGHEVVGESVERDGAGPRFVVRIRRGPAQRVLPGEATERARPGDAPAHADPARGFTPLGAIPEPGGPVFDWRLSERDAMWADELTALSERASAAHWDVARDVPWEAADGLAPDVERAVVQVMTFLAQNEYAAFYVPARHLAEVNPAYPEVLVWLASHVHDEARHVEVFTRRALAGGGAGHALASTELSLHTLLEERNFTNSALLLNVLGEGTFLDLLWFIAEHGPDAATRTAARLARRDERRHVHFGIAHLRRAIAADPDLVGQLVASVERRAAKLAELSGLSPLLTEALTLMAARSLAPAELAEAAAAVRGLEARMARNRVRRLLATGLDEPTATHLSDLHTPNLM
jgi:TusA-related sulfurtransferase